MLMQTAEATPRCGSYICCSTAHSPPWLQSNVRRMLGYFALVGLLRVHSILGDYTAALQVR